MKEKFLALVEEVKNTGIVEKLTALYDASDEEGFKVAWQKFLADNKKLCNRINKWSEKFIDADSDVIFSEGETIKNPMEIAIFIKVINDSGLMSECELFENWEDIVIAIKKLGNNFANSVANCAFNDMIADITIDCIFNGNSEQDDEAEN